MEREAGPGRSVGRLLCEQREALGLSRSDVADRLRIRLPYIEAIEAGRFDQLPGAAYIPAFLRTYAVHLGLDPARILSAYRFSGAVPIERPLVLPSNFPRAERRAPFGIAVVTVLLVVAAGYGAWHLLPRDSATVALKVPPVPDRLLAANPEPAVAGATIAAATETRLGGETRPAQGPPASVWNLPKAETVAPVAAAPVQAGPVIALPLPTPPAAPVQYAPTTTIGQAQAAQPPVIVAPLEARAVPQPQQELPRGELSLPVGRDTPIAVRVDSWVELRAPNGDVLAQTYMRAGESYTIPAGIAYRVVSAR